MDRRGFLKAAGLGAAAAAVSAWGRRVLASAPAGPAAGRSDRRPNILLILADDLGHEKLGCYGGTSYPTPELDALARGGIRFDRCYANPLCTPSRVKIMTGRYLFRNYVGFGMYPQGEVSFGQVLKEAGYATCLAGKWQLGGKQNPKDIGFDEYAIHPGSKHWGVGVNENGRKVRGDAKQYVADTSCEFLCRFVDKHRAGSFFAYFPMFLMHAPVGPTPDSPAGSQDHYGDMIRYMDKVVGRLVRKLEDLGIRKDTLILFTGDNGSAQRSQWRGQTVKGGKGSMKDQGTHVPLIANWPAAMPAGRVCDDLVDFSDFLPTLAQAAGAKLPPDRVIDGYSFYPQLLGHKGRPREWAFVHHWQSGRKPELQTQWARDQRYKLYRVVKGRDAKAARLDGMLFDTQADLEEEAPIPPGQGSAEAEAARRKLARVLDTIQDHKTPPLPPGS